MASFEETSIGVRTLQAAEALEEGHSESTVAHVLGAEAVHAALKADPYLEAALLRRVRSIKESE